MASSSLYVTSSVLSDCDLLEGVGSVRTKLADGFCLVIVSKSCKQQYLEVFEYLQVICEATPPSVNLRLTVGSCVVVYESELWLRGYILSVLDDDVYRVALCDSCTLCTASATDIRICPKQFLEIPKFGVQARLNECLTLSQKKCIKRGVDFNFEILDSNGESATALLTSTNISSDVIHCQVTLTPWCPKFEDGLRCLKLVNNCKAQLLSYSSQHNLYLTPLDDCSAELRNSVIQDVVAYCEEAPDMERLPDPGELVASRFTSDEIYYRAQVISSNRDRVQVIYVDFGNVEYVTLDRLKPLDDHLKQIPCTAVHVSLKGVRKSRLTLCAINFFDMIILSDSKVRVNFTDSYTKGVILFSEFNENVNTIVDGLLTPKWKLNLDAGCHPLDDECLTVSDHLHYVDLPENEKLNLFILSKNSCNDFHACVIDDVSVYILKSLPKEMDSYCKSVCMDCYTPRVNELCLAMYGDEWLRAVCLRIRPIGCAVHYLDWGNIEILSPSFIRKMPEDFAEFPALASRCKINGLSENLSDDARKQLDKMIPLYSIHTACVNNRNREIYGLDIPTLKLPKNDAM